MVSRPGSGDPAVRLWWHRLWDRPECQERHRVPQAARALCGARPQDRPGPGPPGRAGRI